MAGGVVRLGCAQSLSVALLAPVIHSWHRVHPRVSITVQEFAVEQEALHLIASDAVDVAVLPTPPAGPFTVIPLAEEEIVLAAEAGHPLAEQPTLRVEDLDGASVVHFAPDNGWGIWLDQQFARAGIRVETVMRTSVTSAAPQLAAAGLGVAVCPVSAVSDGFPGAVRSFTPRWVRQLAAVTPAEPDVLAARFIEDLRHRGVRMPRGMAETAEQDSAQHW